jgi:hypothetical protein
VLLLSGIIFIISEIRYQKLLRTVTKSYRGNHSERALVLKLLKNGIHARTIFHDLYAEKFKDNYAQIDIAVATKVGIIVFEVKDYSGWIFGNARYNEWTQVLAYGKIKHRFYNPIKQNEKHIIGLRKQVNQFENIPFYSIVVFYGDCEFKDISYVPEGTFLIKPNRVMEVVNMIINTNEAANYTDKHEVLKVLKNAVENGESSEIQYQHNKNVKDLLGQHRIFR